LTLNTNGTIAVATGTPSGTYTLTYRICENGATPANCDTATATILISNVIHAVNDNPTAITAGDTALSVIANDTLDGSPAVIGTNLGQVSLSGVTVPSGLTLNTNGTIAVATGTPSGTYTLTYRICENGATPANCDTATATIVVLKTSPADSDGDGVTDLQEALDGTDPNNPCSSKPSSITLPFSQNFLFGDCDGDGLTNGQEIGLNPKVPFDTNNNGIPDYLENNNYKLSEDDLEIFNSLSPNGDGNNDVFVVRGIENYLDNTLTVLNRWGVQVYEVTGYGQNGNFFKGYSDGRHTINRDIQLPEDTYFYILRYVNKAGVEKQRSGYLYLKR
jgi:gliding motility-associated-like protein